MSLDTSETPKYECDVCGNEFSDSAGVLACVEHFYCNDCATEVFHRSLKDNNEFPASCCARSRHGLPPSLFEDLLGKEFIDSYRLKLSEHYTPESIRVYCANAHCARYHHPRSFDNSDHRRTIVACDCGTTTCVGCKSEWQADHACVQLTSMSRPAWVPEYSSDCRIKQCPKCHEYIQLSEACNHMECSMCHHQFCFVCMVPWKGFHDNAGCPMYGDPDAGYDDKGFERTGRGIHIFTGRDREGYDRIGRSALGEDRAGHTVHDQASDEDSESDLESDSSYMDAMDDYIDWGSHPQFEEMLSMQNTLQEHAREIEELTTRLELITQLDVPELDNEPYTAESRAQQRSTLVAQLRGEIAHLHEERQQIFLRFQRLLGLDHSPVVAEEYGNGEATEPAQRSMGPLTPAEMFQEQDVQDYQDTEAADDEPFAHHRFPFHELFPPEGTETREEILQDLRLDQMFDAEQSLHDSCNPSIQIEGLAASGAVQCSIAVHANLFAALEEFGEAEKI
jgi:hypothetical protein